jgi:hypothetical protein
LGFLAYNLLHLIHRFYLWGEDARRPIEWVIMRIVKAGTGSPITPGIGMYMLHRLFRYVTTTGWYSIGSIEGA